MSWFDTHAASAAARSWLAGGNRLEVEARAIALQLDALHLHGAPAGTRALDLAADELHTLARFTIAVRDRARRADRLPDTETEIARLWSDVAALVDQTAARRHGEATERATARFLATIDPTWAREHFEARHGDDPVDVLSQLTGTEAQAYWDALPESIQLEIAERRPDVVALDVLTAGSTVSEAVADALDRANAFGRFEESFAVELGISVNARIVAIEIGAGLSATITKRSDDSVELTLMGAGSAGAGLDVDVPHVASAGVAAATVVELHQRFRFADEDEAARAIDTLRQAAREDASLRELARDAGGVVWNRAVADWNASAAALNWLVPFGDPVPELPGRDLTPETVRRLRDLWVTNGVTRTESSGSEIAVSAEFQTAFGAIDVALSGEATARLMRYDVEAADGPAAVAAGAEERTGVAFSGTTVIDAVVPTGMSTSANAAAGVGFVADLHHIVDEGTFLTLTLHTDLEGGTATGLIDLGVAGIDAAHDHTAQVTLEMTVPVEPDTVDAVGQLAGALARHRWPTETIDELAEHAEVAATISTGTVSSRSAEVGVGIVGIDASIEQAAHTTVAALHRYPGGETFSRIEVDRLIDAARAGRRRGARAAPARTRNRLSRADRR